MIMYGRYIYADKEQESKQTGMPASMSFLILLSVDKQDQWRQQIYSSPLLRLNMAHKSGFVVCVLVRASTLKGQGSKQTRMHA